MIFSRKQIELITFCKLKLKGWTETTSGVHAIDIMHFFYKLSYVVGASFVDDSKPDKRGLEELIKWFLKNIIDFNNFI